jgi:hypothetical protein
MALFQKNPSVPFIRAGGFLFLLLIFLGHFTVKAAESSLPPDTVLQQVASWKKYRVKLMTSPSQAQVRGPVEIFVEAKREEMETPFPGTIRLGVERLSPSHGPLEETELGDADQETKGLWRVTQVFQEAGVYAVRATLIDAEGEIFVLQGKITISSQGNFSWKKPLLYGVPALILVSVFFFGRRARGRA